MSERIGPRVIVVSHRCIFSTRYLLQRLDIVCKRIFWMNESDSLELYFSVFESLEEKLTWFDGGNYRSFGSRNLLSRIFRTSICGDLHTDQFSKHNSDR